MLWWLVLAFLGGAVCGWVLARDWYLKEIETRKEGELWRKK